MTDTPLDLDAILAAHASASPYGRTEVAGRFHASYYADDADVALVFASIPALIAALRKANAQVAAVLALPEREWSEDHADSPESRAARAYNSALLAARRAITGGTDEG